MARGSICSEIATIYKAREAYDSSSDKYRWHKCVSEFTQLHNFSMVAYSVGMHHEIFRHRQESLENKILFCIPLFDKDNRGQGGSIIGLHYVFALLDWK